MSDDTAATRSSRPSTIGLHHGAKSLIRNVMRHTDTHNRLLEESEMWQIYHRMKNASSHDGDNSDKKKTPNMERLKEEIRHSSDGQGRSFKEPDIHNSFLYDDRRDMKWDGGSRRGNKRAHMDDSSDDDRKNAAASSRSTFWMRQLHKTEETDPDRWGHAGFKELYPDAFDSDRSHTGDDNSKQKLKKRKHSKKRHKHKSVTKKKKRKHLDTDSDKKKKTKRKNCKSERSKEKKRKKHEKSNNESGNDSSDDNLWVERKNSDIKSGSEVSKDDSDSENESRKKRGRRNMKTESEREKRSAIQAGMDKPHWSKKRRKH